LLVLSRINSCGEVELIHFGTLCLQIERTMNSLVLFVVDADVSVLPKLGFGLSAFRLSEMGLLLFVSGLFIDCLFFFVDFV